MKIIAGLLTATSGSVLINGIDIVRNPRALREKIGYMPDFFGVYDSLKVDEYMDFYAGTYYIPYRERKQLTANLLDIVDLADKASAYVDSLSRGMKQRLCLARSLIHDPEVLILDEPASGLDPRARVEMKEVLKQLRTLGKTIIISSHILTELAELCSAVGIIDKGKLTVSGSIQDIMRRTTRSRLIYVKPLDKMDELVALLNEKPNVNGVTELVEDVEFGFDGGEAELSALLKEIVIKDIPVSAFKEKEGSLEDLFMRLTGEEGVNNA
jgi:ABC-2 type transport system ATP-binding protein